MSNILISYPLEYKRRQTTTVKIGSLAVGSKHPIVLQSMLTSHTFQPEACLKEMKQLIAVGCQLIRLAIPAKRDLEGMPEIRRLMEEEGIAVPLIADIHFAPHLALDACEFFEKIRINPGNFSDRAKNSSARSQLAFDMQEGKERFRARIAPLSQKLKQKNLALRIGVNQGSLSSRMLQAYGDSPLGMVESALEAVSLFQEASFENIIVSLKSSNPLVVQKAYRLFCQRLPKNLPLPLHLGVTEAGDNTAGRSKSIVGIAPLLLDGLGDTIRVSLTEDSVNEILFARKFLNYFEDYKKNKQKKPATGLPSGQTGNQVKFYPVKFYPVKFYQAKLESYRVENTPLTLNNKKLRLAAASNVKVGIPQDLKIPKKDFFEVDFNYQIKKGQFFLENEDKPLFVWQDANQKFSNPKDYAAILFDFDNPVRDIRYIYQQHKKLSLPAGVFLPAKNTSVDFSLEIEFACLLGEGLLDFLLLHSETTATQLTRISYLLQATKTKISRTEYIACPSCGRTLFNLQEVTEKVKEKTDHLKGVKIGVMGCMVNGPGEMADADFGYVGSATGKVDLYLGHKRIQRSVPETQAVEKLIELIKEEGRWVDDAP